VEYSSLRQLDIRQKQAAFRVIFKLAMGTTAGDLAADLVDLPAGALEEILPIVGA
jgi:hypothetical protein